MPEHLQFRWDRCNAIVKGWLTTAINKDLAYGFIYSTTVVSIWNDLRERFNKIDRTRVIHLSRELYHIQQRTLSIANSFRKLKVIWDELAAIDDDILCGDYVISPRVATSRDKQKLIQLLIDLNETYHTIRSNLLMMSPLPTLNFAYSVLVEEEI